MKVGMNRKSRYFLECKAVRQVMELFLRKNCGLWAELEHILEMVSNETIARPGDLQFSTFDWEIRNKKVVITEVVKFNK